MAPFLKKGIFHMPELAFAYAVGKQFSNLLKTLGLNPVWERETKRDGNPGPVDLVVETDGAVLLVEFKIVDTATAYEGDIRKLRNLRPTATEGREVFCLFCALIDVAEEKDADDDRLKALKNLTAVGELEKFRTAHWQKQAIQCWAGLWEV